MYVCMYVCMCVFVYAPTHPHTHTHTGLSAGKTAYVACRQYLALPGRTGVGDRRQEAAMRVEGLTANGLTHRTRCPPGS